MKRHGAKNFHYFSIFFFVSNAHLKFNFLKSILTFFALIIASHVDAQDIAFARKMLDTLTSRHLWGRGYTNNGMQKTASYLSAQMHEMGLEPLQKSSFMQNFSYPVNTFPSHMEVVADGKQLVPGKDFIVKPESRAIKGKVKLVQTDSTTFIDPKTRVIVSLEKKLTWSVAPEVADYTHIQVLKNSVAELPVNWQVNISNNYVEKFAASNICGMVPGTLRPDSFLVFTAHYDHLGGLGADTYFPGANDNASGVSLLMSLAKYYAQNPQPYSMVFICFAGEEAGLVGSKYFTENPLIPLSKIRFLTNVDLVGTGEDGITVVNATEFQPEFELLNQINDRHKLLTKINARGKAANSDHYWFSQKGVPSFFIYTLGGISAYHDVFDKGETLPLNEFDDLFRLIIDFNKTLMGKIHDE
jgi:aminopeptidase YwaD